MFAGFKRKQALLRSNLPGINPVADEVNSFTGLGSSQTFFKQFTFEALMPKKTFYALTQQHPLHILFYSSIRNLFLPANVWLCA